MHTDASKFNLDYKHGHVRVWRTQGERHIPEYLSKVSGNSNICVLVWGILGYYGVGELVVLQGNVNAVSYIEVLSDNLMLSGNNIFGDNQHPFIFQQDNATPHTAHATQRWLDDNDIRVIQWPLW